MRKTYVSTATTEVAAVVYSENNNNNTNNDNDYNNNMYLLLNYRVYTRGTGLYALTTTVATTTAVCKL